jgi:FkbM family methyltransferase
MKINHPTYLDIGAYDPIHLSNTFFFYEQGNSGVCVEPDPSLHQRINKLRKRDICLNMGVGVREEKAKFYILSTKCLNTFSLEEAEHYQAKGWEKIVNILDIQLITVNKIIRDHFSSHPNFVSMDVEGLDFEIIQSFDFSICRPEVFCIETLTYTQDKEEKKLNEIIDYMITQNYLIYADTYINTIFVDQTAWSHR